MRQSPAQPNVCRRVEGQTGRHAVVCESCSTSAVHACTSAVNRVTHPSTSDSAIDAGGHVASKA
eukprot:2915-Heterococcus_DN1.PRE.1